jgi:hypothetical protein
VINGAEEVPKAEPEAKRHEHLDAAQASAPVFFYECVVVQNAPSMKSSTAIDRSSPRPRREPAECPRTRSFSARLCEGDVTEGARVGLSHRRTGRSVPALQAATHEVTRIPPLPKEPGLIAYECPACSYVTSVYVLAGDDPAS